MPNLCKLTLMGHVGVIRSVKQGPYGDFQQICVAVNSGKDEKKITEWFNVFLQKRHLNYATKLVVGDAVFVDGRLSFDEYMDKHGERKRQFNVNADDFMILSSKKESVAQAEIPAQVEKEPIHYDYDTSDVPF